MGRVVFIYFSLVSGAGICWILIVDVIHVAGMYQLVTWVQYHFVFKRQMEGFGSLDPQ